MIKVAGDVPASRSTGARRALKDLGSRDGGKEIGPGIPAIYVE